MHDTIEAIIRGIHPGMYFDSHFIIDSLIREHSDTYLSFAAENLPRGRITETLHSRIANLIADFQGTLVERIGSGSNSMSFNIHGRASQCALWLRTSAN